MERRDEAAAAGEGSVQRPEDGLARLERAADIGDGDAARRLIIRLIEETAHDGRDHLGLCRCALKDALRACVARRCGFAHQGRKGRDARAVRHVLLREGDDIEIVGKLEFLPYEVAQRPRRVASVALAGERAQQLLAQPTATAFVSELVVPAAAAQRALAVYAVGDGARAGDDHDAVGKV